MTGLHRHERVGSFIILNLDLVDRLGSWETAGVLQRIEWRCGDGEWTATFEDLAAEVRLSEHRVRRAVHTLEEGGYITRRRLSPYNPTPVWSVIPHPEAESFPTSDRESKNRDHVVTETPSMCDENPASPPIENGLINLPPTPQGEQEDGTLFAAAETTEPEVTFDDWYRLFPRKVAKGDARKAWQQVTRRTSPAVILAGLQRSLTFLQREHERGYCPHPGTWLRAERWEDEASVTPLPVRDVAPALYDAPYDPAYEATLPPPPRQDLYG